MATGTLESAVATPGRRRTPRWLWSMAGAIVALVTAPLVYLVATVVADPAVELLRSGRTGVLLLNTAWLVVAVTASAAGVGVAAAWVVTRVEFRLRRLWSIALALPLVVPSYVGALVLIAATGPRGLLAEAFGLAVPRLEGFWGAWLSLTVFTYPYVYLVAAVALRRLDPALEEAARGLGASRWHAFRTVVLPQLRPALGASGLLVALYTLSDFGAVSLMRYDTLTRAIFTQWEVRIDKAPALSLAVLLVVVAAVLLWVEERTRGRGAYYSTRPARRAGPVPLGTRGRWLVRAFLGTVGMVGLAVPVGVLAFWLGRGILAGQDLGPVVAAAFRSLAASLAAAGLAALASVPIAVLVVRYPSRAASRMDRAVWAVYALPHITVGLAFVVFTLRWAPPLYQSLAVLVGAYAAIFLPQASGAAQTVLRQVNPHVEEASRSLGSGSLRTLARITVPLMSRGLAGGAALVFLTAMKELPATLLLRPTGFDTLAMQIWQQTSEGFYTRASASALVLLAISAVPMFLLTTRELRDAG